MNILVSLALGLFACGASSTTVSEQEPVDAGVELSWSSASITQARANAERPHVVLIVLCTVRRDQLALYGGPVQMPVLEGLASRGRRFDDLVAAAPWTKPSMVAITTGQHASAVQMVEAGESTNNQVLPSEVDTLAEQLAVRGYQTWGAASNPNGHQVFGFDQGFDHYLQPAKLWREEHSKVSADTLLATFFERLDAERHEGPLYLQWLLVDAHAPYPEGYATELDAYRAGLGELDARLGRALDALAERGITLENSYFLVVSDHGEGLSMPAHHGRAHGKELVSSQIDGVGVFAGPGVDVGKVSGVWSHVDLAPFLLRHVDEVPGAYAMPSGRAVYSQTFFGPVARSARVSAGWTCVVDEGQPVRCSQRGSRPERAPNPAEQHALQKWHMASWSSAQRYSGSQVEQDPEVTEQLRRLGYVEEP